MENLDNRKEEVKISNERKITVVPLGGADEIGMNMTLYIVEHDGQKRCIMIDCGVAFEDLHGASVAMPDIKSLDEQNIKVEAIVLTHGHEDHIGAIPYLYDLLECPIYGTPFTMKLVRKKLEGKKDVSKLHEVNCGERRNIASFDIEWISVTHSIPDSAMLRIEANGVRILHTGDWRLDDNPIVGSLTDKKRIAELGHENISAMICDSTNIHEEESAASEGEVAESLANLVKNTKSGRFVLTCFSSNIARVKSCIDAAKMAGRKVLIMGGSLVRNLEAAVALDYVDENDFMVDGDVKSYKPEQLMVICTGSQGEYNSALWKIANKVKNSGGILEKGDTLVFSARIIDGKQLTVRRIINNMVERGVKVLHPWNSKDSTIHASGHPGQPDIAQMLDWVKPRCVVPVHSEAEHRVAHIAFAKSKGYDAFNVRDGVAIDIYADKIVASGKFSHGKLVYDGNRLVQSTNKIFQERADLAQGGVVCISLGVKQKKLQSLIRTFGIDDGEKESEEDVNKKKKFSFRQKLRQDIERSVSQYSSSDFKFLREEIIKKARDAARNSAWNQLKKNPVIIVQMWVDGNIS
jgi:ribonuclease J